MKNKRIIMLSIMLIMATIIIGATQIVNYMLCMDSCPADHILATTENGDVLEWENEYKTTVQGIVSKMSYSEYTYPITVDDLQNLNMPYLYCRGHNTYLRGTGSNTVSRTGSLENYEIKVKTGKTGIIGSYSATSEVAAYGEASTDLTWNEYQQKGRTPMTVKQVYDGTKIFEIPGIKQKTDEEKNDDHACEGDDYDYDYKNYDEIPIKMDSMSRYLISKEEILYTDETEPGYMAYDAMKSYILTVVKGGHYGPGQVAFWRLKDTLGLTGTNGEKEVYDGITEQELISKLQFEDKLYDVITVGAYVAPPTTTPTTPTTPSTDYVEQENYYDQTYLSGGEAGVLYSEAVAMGRHVYSTEMFKKDHNDQLIADCTDKANLNVSYVKNGDYYLVGPFKLEYVRTVMQSTGSLIPEVKNKPNSIYSFGGLTGAKLTYTRINGATGELVIDENTSDFEFVVTANEVPRGFDTDYKFPIAEEEFYLKVPYQGTDEQTAIKTLDKIEYELDNTYAKGKVYNLKGRHWEITWDAKSYDFQCEESATICPTHHTDGSHCNSGCVNNCSHGNCGHTSQTSDCGKYTYNVANSCSGHRYTVRHTYTKADGSTGSYTTSHTDYCSCSSPCTTTVTLCDTHHHVAGSTHAKNRGYWLESSVTSGELISQPLMWMDHSEVHRRTYTATSDLNVDMTMDFGGFVWVDAYTHKNEEGLYYGDNVWDPTIQIDDQGIDTRKQYVDVYLLKRVADGKTATGEQYISEYGDPGMEGATITDNKLYYAVDASGNKIYAETDANGEYKFDLIPVLNSTYEGYVVVFIYDGQTYQSVYPLYKQVGSGDNKSSKYAGEEYIDNENKYDDFDISSMGNENAKEREAFNAKFDEFLGKEDIASDKSTNGLAKGVSGKNLDLHYNHKEDDSGRVNSILQTTESNKPLDIYKFESRTSETKVGDKSLVYPLTDVYNIKMSDKADIDIKGTNVSGGDNVDLTDVESVYGAEVTDSYGTRGSGYTQHINLGIKFRPQGDLSVTKDLYSARTIVKGNDMSYAYGEALRNEKYFNYGGLGDGTVEWEDTKKVQKAISDKMIYYQLFLYEADREYNSAVEYIAASDAIKEVRMGRYASSAGYGKATSTSDLFYNQARGSGSSCYVCGSGTDLCNYHKAEIFDTELRTYLTYKITIRNENVKTVYGEINELLDYHDDTLELIDRDVYAAIVNENGELLRDDGKANAQIVASKSQYYYYEAGTDDILQSGEVIWAEDGTEDGVEIKTKAQRTAVVNEGKTKNEAFDTNEQITYQKLKTDTFKDIKLAKNQRIEIYVTYRVKEEAKKVEVKASIGGTSELAVANGFEGDVGQIILGKKYNVAEISNYSTYRIENGVYTRYGRVDKDSAPDNINLRDGDKANYDDDGDAAPPIEIEVIKEGETESITPDISTTTIGDIQKDFGGTRTITGVVWEDGRTIKINDYEQYVGDGVYNKSSEKGIEGVTVQLIEKVKTLNGTEEDFLNPDIKADAADIANGRYKYGAPISSGTGARPSKGGSGPQPSTPTAEEETIGNVSGCEYKFETKTNSEGVYSFHNIPAGTYVVRFIYGSEIIETPYSALPADEIVKYGPGNEVEVTAEEMPQTYNGQDYKSTTYQPDIDNDLNNDGYIDNEWDNVAGIDLGRRISDARDNEVRRLENIAYSRTVNNKVATELDALTTNSTSTLEDYNFSVGVVNGVPTVIMKEDVTAGSEIIGNAQVESVTQSDGNYVIERDLSLIHNPPLGTATPNVAQYTWMYADTAKFTLGVENDTLINESKVSEVMKNEYFTEYNELTGESIKQDGKLLEMAIKMLEPVTTKTRFIQDSDITLNDGALREAAMIYNMVPGQIVVENEQNFRIEAGTVLNKFGHGTSSSGSSVEIMSYPAANRTYNIDFGIVERPKNSVELQKWVSSLELTLSDGRQLFYIPFDGEYDDETGEVNSIINKEGCTSEVYDTSTPEGINELVSHFTNQKSAKMIGGGVAQGFIYVNMDEELLQGATISVGYGMKVINTSEVDTVGLLSYFDDGDTIMHLAEYIKGLSSKVVTKDFIEGGTIGGGTFLADAAAQYTSLATSESNPLLKLKYANLAERFNKANIKLSNVANINIINDYTINNPTINGVNLNGDINRASTPYGLFVGSTYYTGKAAENTAKVYAVESKVEQIIDYVDNELGAEDGELLLENGSWAKLDLTQLFGNYVQSNVLNGINSLGITNEGTLINIFESAVINISQEILDKVGATLDTSNSEIEEQYRTVYEKLLAVAGVNVTLQELVHSLGEDGVEALIEIYTAADATSQDLLELIVGGLTVVDKAGNRYITLEFKDANEIRNNVLISVNDPARNPSLGNYLVPKTLIKDETGADRATINIKGTNNGTTDDNTKFEADISLIAKKTVSAEALASEIEDMVFNNAAEIVQISNKVGRKDKMAVAGNLLIGEGEWESTTGYDPEDGEPKTDRETLPGQPIFAEYDSAATARIIFAPPTGQGISRIIHSDIFQGGLIGLIVLAIGIVVIKVTFFKKKKIYK